MANRCLGPLRPIHNIANEILARGIAERIFRCKAVPGSPQWRSFVETEIRLALDVTDPRALHP
jgi:hypothetical protein